MLSMRKWAQDAAVHLCGGLLICLSASMALAHFIGMAEDVETPTAGMMFAQALSFQGPVAALIFWFVKVNHMTLSQAFGLRSGSWKRSLSLGFFGGLLITAITIALHQLVVYLMPLVGLNPVEQISVATLRESQDVMTRVCIGISAVVLAPILEEALFRGLIYPNLKILAGGPLAAFLTATLFSLAHGNAASVLPLFFLSYALVDLYERTDNLTAPIIAHFFFNLFNYIAVTLLITEPTAG